MQPSPTFFPTASYPISTPTHLPHSLGFSPLNQRTGLECLESRCPQHWFQGEEISQSGPTKTHLWKDEQMVPGVSPVTPWWGHLAATRTLTKLGSLLPPLATATKPRSPPCICLCPVTGISTTASLESGNFLSPYCPGPHLAFLGNT